MNLKIEKNKLSADSYQAIRATTNWGMFDTEAIEKALEKDLFSVCVYHLDRPIGMGRIIGDGQVYFYLQDVVVIPEYQRKGVGKMIMDCLEDYLASASHNHSFIGLMAAKNLQGFYEKYGYQLRSEDSPGMFKRIQLKRETEE